MTETLKEQSNPFSTGGGGGNFETRVQAAFTVLMLTGRIAPCLPAWPIVKLKLQGRYAGFNTDDFIVFTQDPQTRTEAKLLAQLKHSISITVGNEVFGEVVQAAWNDFNDPSIFNVGTDAFALITGPISATEINNTRTLLEWARHCEDEKEFIQKVETSGFSNEAKRSKLKVLKTHLSSANGGIDVSDEQLWSFLKSFHLLGYDLDTESGSTISLLQSLIAQSSTESASLLWSSILDAVQTANQTAGTITLETLPEEISRAFVTNNKTQWDLDIKKLKEHGDYIIEGIRSNIGGLHINRPEYFDNLIEVAEEAKFVFLTGERGCGKSSLLREFAEHMKDNTPVYCLRTEDLDKAHLDHVFSGIGLTSSLGELEVGFALIPKKYLLLESLEKLLELRNTAAFTDLIRFIQKNQGWTIIASGRDYAYQQITFNYLGAAGVRCSSIVIENFKDDDIQRLCDSFEFLKPLSKNQLLKNPFYADLAYRVAENGTVFSNDDSEREFKIAVWRDVITREQVRAEGMPLKRRRAFIDIAVKRAKRMVYGVPETMYDSDALLKLEEDNLIRRDPSKGIVSLSHDVLEDWGLESFIEETFQNNSNSVKDFLDAVGHEPAMNRAYRLWLNQKMRSGENVTQFILSILNDKIIASCWRDETITAVLLGDNPYEFLMLMKDKLFENEGELLKRFCFVLRISCKTPNQELIKQLPDIKNESSNELGTLFLTPYGLGWESIILFLFENRDCIAEEILPHVIAVLNEWSSLIHIEEELPDSSREAGLLALHLLSMIKDSYRDEGERKKLLGVIIRVIPVILNEFNGLLDSDVFGNQNKRRRLSYVQELCTLSLTCMESAFLCKHIPDTLIKLAFHKWVIDEGQMNKYTDFHKDVSEYFGLHEYGSEVNFFPASGVRGPFRSLLRFHPRKGLDFIIQLLNISAEKYAHSDLDSPEMYSDLRLENYRSEVEQVEIVLNDGTTVKQYCSQRLWNGYRGHSVVPYLLQSALMALENWLIAWAEIPEGNETLEWIYNYILRNSNSVMPTAVLISVATGFPNKLAKAAIPLMRVPELYSLDLTRTINERGGNEVNWFGVSRDPFSRFYAEERRTAALRPWRKESLETLITRLQFTEFREEVLRIIDELRSKVSCDEGWQFRFHRIDSRGWEPVADEENGRIIFTSGALEPHLEEVQQKFEAEQTITNRFMQLYLWSDKVLKNEVLEREYYANWRDALKEVKELLEILVKGEVNDLSRMHAGAVIKAASIFIRDHSKEMNEDDLAWCFKLICEAVLSYADTKNMITDSLDHNGSAAAASVLPFFMDFAERDEEKFFVKKMIAISLTHSDETVKVAAADGIKRHLWLRDPVFAEKCIIGVIKYARLESENFTTRRNRAWEGYDIEEKYSDDQDEAWLENFREQLARGEVTTDLESISFRSHSPWCILNSCFMIPNGSTDHSHVILLSRILTLIFEAEESERKYRYDESEKIELPYELPSKFAEMFAGYFLSISEKNPTMFIEILRSGCDIAPEFMSSLLLYVEYFTEKMGNKKLYWGLWKQLSDKVQDIALRIAHKQDRDFRHDEKTKLIRDMLHADVPWQKVDYEKQDIALGKDLILGFVNNAGINPDVFGAMASLLYHFPTVFLEPGLHILSKHQRHIGGTQLLCRVNTPFYLERCIQRYLLIDNPTPVSEEMHQSCWILLDAIIETASSEAYYLREHLIRSRRISGN
ncbi:ATP-binding protein [Brevibacillus sp. NPDC058079]|uniref:ATP-binding protein n=1 Tax=Brevibacillus sp. NPDC058079 TaxID=3346330 RepID=UPI0036EEC77C